MAIDSTIPVRNAVLATLKANPSVIALVPKTRIYTQRVLTDPTWPFIRYGSPIGTPISASCLDGQELLFAIHAFAKPRRQGDSITGRELESAEDFAARIGAAVAAAVDRTVIAIPRGKVRVRWRGNQLMQDGDEADRFHAIVDFRARAITS